MTRRERKSWRDISGIVESFEAVACADGSISLRPAWTDDALSDEDRDDGRIPIGVGDRATVAELIRRLVNDQLEKSAFAVSRGVRT